MSITKAQLEARMASRLARKTVAGVTFANIQSAVQSSTPAQKAALLSAIRQDRSGDVGATLMGMINAWAAGQAATEAASILADNALTVEEFGRVFGD